MEQRRGDQAVEVVTDASVIVKWFIEEEDSDKALILRDRHISKKLRLSIPSLALYEVLNALKWSRLYDEGELNQIGVALNKYGFSIHPLMGKLKEETIKTAVRHDITIYDASYVALALHLDATLYTADQELVRRIGPPRAIHISEL
jgi:predicted nucleic acid-binding protein